MRRKLVFLLVVLSLMSGCGAAKGLEVSNAWARPAMEGGNGAVYFLLQNHSAARDELTGAFSQAAEAVEIHESRMEGDVMQMQQVTTLPIAGKASIQFEPGGYHIMLIGLKQDLNSGDELQITLEFKDQEDIIVTVPVQETAGNNSMESH